MEVLQMKSIKNVEAATDKVLEKKPGRDKSSVKSQINVMINEVKKGKKANYTWDDATFQLTKKC
jgi:ethanolamine utilization microcompartment shell protein EutL